MSEIKIGSRIVYCHADGGFNALVTAVHGGENELVNLVYVHPESGNVVEETSVLNVYHAKEEKEVPKLVEGKVEMVKQMVSVANGYWRR